MSSGDVESLLHESRVFPPDPEFSAQAHVGSIEQYREMHARSLADPEGFWGEVALELEWFEPWTRVLDWEEPHAKWFVGGKTNLSHNCLDRHVAAGRGDRTCILWEGEPGDARTMTYAQVHAEVCRLAGALALLGVEKGDRVILYMPMVPELAMALLACARIGATHSVVFGGFSSESLKDRIVDCGAKMVITADGGYRRGKVLPLKSVVDEAVSSCPGIEKVLVVKRAKNDIEWHEGRDVWYHDLMEGDLPAGLVPVTEAVPLDAEHPSFILYTSGTTGKPKGLYHTTGGYMVGTYLTSKLVFDLKDDDVYWCTADIGWVTGHSYIVYGPMANGATVLMYEGAPDAPDKDRFWKLIEKYKVTVFYTAPTAIRAFIRWGDRYPEGCDLSSLRLLGTVGEPINPEAWMWYHHKIGGSHCPIVDTWWQTETGAIMITPLPGAVPTKPGSATLPFFGVAPEVVNEKGERCADNVGGFLILEKPWPSMLRGIWGDEERYRQTYWSQVPGKYFAGDESRRDSDGYFWIMGRCDDVLNVSGHRLGTMEVESALVSHPQVAEAAVVGRPHEIKGQAVAAFVSLISGNEPSEELRAGLREHVAREIGVIAKPDDIHFTTALPKTRSGKIMRRLLRDIAAGKESIGDTSTLEDYTLLAKLRSGEED